MRNIIGEAIGRTAAVVSGSVAMYLPEGVDYEFAAGIVRAANSTRDASRSFNSTELEGVNPNRPSHAILVSSNPVKETVEGCTVVTPNESLMYRKDDRLTVLFNNPTELASFDNSTRVGMSQEYPDKLGTLLTLERLSNNILDILVEISGVRKINNSDRLVLRQEIESVLSILINIFRESGGSEKWNVSWFRAVEMGLQGFVCIMKGMQDKDLECRYTDLATWVWAAFGLPQPKEKMAFEKRWKEILIAFQNNWQDAEQATVSIHRLATHPDTDTETHPLAEGNWSQYDRLIAKETNTPSAFQSFIYENNLLTELHLTTHDQFVNPDRSQSEIEPPFLTDQNGISPLFADSLINVVTAELDEDEQGNLLLKSDIHEIVVPTSSEFPDEIDDISSVSAKLIGTKVEWHQEDVRLDSCQIVLSGYFLVKIANKNGETMHGEQNLSVKISDPSLHKYCNVSTPIKLIIVPAETDLLLLFPYNGSKLRRVLFAGSTCFDIGRREFRDDSPYSLELNPGLTKSQILVQSAQHHPICNGRKMQLLSDSTDLYHDSISVSGSSTVEISDKEYHLVPPMRSDKHQSPVIAAAEKLTATVSVPEELDDSLCSLYEKYILGKIEMETKSTLPNLGHVFIPEHEAYEFGDFMEDPRVLACTTDGLSKKISLNPQMKIDSLISESSEMRRFTTAFENLGVFESCGLVEGEDSQFVIPSKVSWKHLVIEKRQELDEYLSSYTALIKLAEEKSDAFTRFWVTYPFSLMIWDDSTPNMYCRAVFLSPLHPLRLSWLAEIETTLWDSTIGLSFMGTIEGWNLPVTGPAETTHARLIAAPMDPGPGQLFLGWSMMVPVATGRPTALQTVASSGTYAVPGCSVGGLNGQVTRSALRTFRRITPYLSTLVVDIASSSQATRLPELDEALLSTAKEWIADPYSPLLGGIRVHDSSCRMGLPPQRALEAMIDSHPDTPVVWRRYDNDEVQSRVRSNVRLLNDSASLLSYSEQTSTAFGIVGPVPLKRHVVGATNNPQGYRTDIFPLTDVSSTDNAFNRALSCAEASDRGFVLYSQPSAEILESTSADWTVAGEAFTSPSALVAMLQGDGSAKQMLWEWRPPFLAVGSRGTDLAVQDRPYITISRISGLFRADLASMISAATESKSTNGQVDSVLSTLGARGIGLSTLLSIGGSQTAGAIGFYATLAMSRSLQNETDPTFILPIDSCDAFMRKLAGSQQTSESTRRADLLLVKITGKKIILSPIEIKSYGLAGENTSRRLPGLSDGSLADAKDQLLSSMELLDKLASKWAEIVHGTNSADKYLWANGFASLLEAASKIQPLKLDDASLVRDRISAVARGEFELVTGGGIITYFANIPRSNLSEDKYYNIEHDDVSGISLLSCQTGYALSNADNESSKLFSDWQQLVSSATSTDGNACVPKARSQVDAPNEVPTVTQTSTEGNQNYAEPSNSTDERGTNNVLANDPSTKSERKADPSSASQNGEDLPAEDQGTFPALNDGIRINVGSLLDTVSESHAWYTPGDTRLNQMNIGIVGDLGTGKTQIIKTLIAKIREESRNTQHESASFLIFDYKNDYQDPDFLEKVGGVVLQPENMPLNIFSRSKKASANNRRRSMEFFDVIQRIYPGVGPVQRQRFSEASVAAFEEYKDRDPVLGEVLERYMSLGKPDSVSSILSDFVHGDIFTEDPAEIRSFEDMMSESVVVVNLHGLGPDQTMKNAIVVLFLNLYYDYMKNTVKVSPRPGRDVPSVRHIASYLLVDEANNIMKYNFDVLQQLMLESREFGFGVILASQFLSHFSSSKVNYTEPLNTWFIHKVPDVTGKQLTQLGLPEANEDTADRIKSLENLCSYYSSYGYRGRFISDNSYYKLYSN